MTSKKSFQTQTHFFQLLENNLKQSIDANLFQLIVEDAFICIAVFKRSDKECVYLNNSAKEILEIQDNRVSDLFELMQPKNNKGDYTLLNSELVEQEGYYQDVLVQKPGSFPIITDLSCRHLSEDVFLIMFRDMTNQKKLQREVLTKQEEIQSAFEELQSQNEDLKVLDKAKDRFVALTTHELKTPLSAMIATAEVIQMDLYDTKEELKGFISTIYNEGRHLLEIVNDILDFSKVQAGKMDLYIEELSPFTILSEHLENFQKMAEDKNVQLHLSDLKKEHLCYFDQLRLRQITANVINNAIKFTKEKTHVHISLTEHEKYLRISISDEGPGIDVAHQERVFNEFETVGNVNTHHKGTGLGMPISKRLIELMGGQISFDSKPDQGTTFHIDVPTTKVLDSENYRERPDFAQEVA